MSDLNARIRSIVGSTADWAAHDLVLGDGEIAIERVSAHDTRLKVGDGVSRFSALPYSPSSLGTAGGAPINAGGGTMTGPLNLPNGVVPTGDNAVSRNEGDKLYVNITGDTMTGPLLLPPLAPTGRQAVSREEGDKIYMPAGGGTLTGGLTGTTASFSGALNGSTAAFTGAGSFGGAVTLPVGEPTGNQAVSRTEGDKLYVNVNGDTMTGALLLPAGAPTGRQALSKEEADKLYLKIAVSGGMTFKGAQDMTAAAPATPARGDYYAASADATVAASWTGIAGQAVNKGDLILWDGTNWHAIAQDADLTKYLPLTGGTLTGDLTLNGGTANGVVYLNGTKVATTGAALQFDGNNLGIGTTTPNYKLDVSATGNVVGQFKSSGPLSALYLADGGTTASSVYIGTVGNDFRVISGSNENFRVDARGNLSVNVPAPKNWPLGANAVDGQAGAVTLGTVLGATISYNAYNDGAWKYKTAQVASAFVLDSKGMHWSTAVAGAAADAPITFTQAMTLTANGLLFVGKTTVTGTNKIQSADSINLGNCPVYADNTAAKAGGLVNGDVYRTATGQLMIAF